MLARAIIVSAVIATGCDDYSLQIHVELGAFESDVAAVYVELYSVAGDAPFGCDEVAFGEVAEEGLRRASLGTFLVDGGGGKVLRAGAKVIVARGYSADGALLVAGCAELAEVSDAPVEIEAVPLVTAEALLPDDREETEPLPESIPVAITDPRGMRAGDRRVRWRLLAPGPDECPLASEDPQSDDASGQLTIQVGDQAAPGPYALEIRPMWGTGTAVIRGFVEPAKLHDPDPHPALPGELDPAATIAFGEQWFVVAVPASAGSFIWAGRYSDQAPVVGTAGSVGPGAVVGMAMNDANEDVAVIASRDDDPNTDPDNLVLHTLTFGNGVPELSAGITTVYPHPFRVLPAGDCARPSRVLVSIPGPAVGFRVLAFDVDSMSPPAQVTEPATYVGKELVGSGCVNGVRVIAARSAVGSIALFNEAGPELARDDVVQAVGFPSATTQPYFVTAESDPARLGVFLHQLELDVDGKLVDRLTPPSATCGSQLAKPPGPTQLFGAVLSLAGFELAGEPTVVAAAQTAPGSYQMVLYGSDRLSDGQQLGGIAPQALDDRASVLAADVVTGNGHDELVLVTSTRVVIYDMTRAAQ